MQRVGRWGSFGAGLLVVSFVLAPFLGVAAAGTPSVGIVSCTGATTQFGVNAIVTWNGQDVCAARSTGSAISTTFGPTANVTFTWQSPLTSPVNLTDARLAMYYFGFPVVTRDVGPTASGSRSSGTFAMNWASGELTYAFEGLFRLTATIFAANGSTVFAESFYLKVAAPAMVGAIVPLALLALGVYEGYNIAVSGRQALLAGRSPAPTPLAPSGTSPGAAAASEPPDPATEGATPPSPSSGSGDS